MVIIPCIGRDDDDGVVPPAEVLSVVFLSAALLTIVIRLWIRDVGRSVRALRESESRYRSLVGSMDEFVFTLDRAQRYTGIFGRWPHEHLDPDTLIGKTASDVFGIEFRSRHDATFCRVVGGASTDYEWAATIDGSRYYFHTSLSPLRDVRGEVVGAVGVTRDVTEKVNLDEAYRDTAELLHGVVDASPAAMFTLDENGRIHSANTAAAEMLGKPREELIGEMLVRPADSVSATQMLRNCAVRGETISSIDVRRWRHDGRSVDLSISAAPLNLRKSGAPVVAAIALDVTSRRRADEMLQRYRVMTQHLRDIVLFVGSNGRITEANEAAVQAYGWPREELIGLPLRTISGDGSCCTHPNGDVVEKEHRRRDGTTFPVEVSAAGGEIDGEEVVFVLARDVTSRRWASRIRTALREERFVLNYQPVVRIDNGEAEHYEALVRMIDEDGSTISPEKFISAAERFGLMPQIDRWVFDNVLRVLDTPGTTGRIFVNISGASLGDTELLAHIERSIGTSNVSPDRLAFEITESAAIHDLCAAQNWIRKLKDLGCLFAIDDFGVGFSSFSYLRTLSADYVKIDRSFVSDVDTNPTNRALVQAVTTVAQTLGKEVIAEGVETDAHAAVLLELGIELAQGFRWGVPQSDPFATVELAGEFVGFAIEN